MVEEAKALCDELWLAIQADFNNIVIEGDNMRVIQELKGKIQVPLQIYSIIEDTHIWPNQGIQLLINHILRNNVLTLQIWALIYNIFLLKYMFFSIS